MGLVSGTRIGPYEVTGTLGAGGMGEVYRATDTNLKRGVALKVLPELVAADADRLARFQREAEVLATLNHPNIAAIYGLERSGGTTALVMELVEGPTLADRIVQGPMPVDEALPIAKQIAEALEAAHEQGIIHRDLKPANIKVRPDGTVKVLDFGLAKAMEPQGIGAGVSVSLTQSPTFATPAMTQVGMILGTAAYMSPEQAKGRAADRRSDMWSFGCVLFELITGRQVFEGDDIGEVIADVIKGQVPFDRLPRDTPPGLHRLLRRCLRKDPAKRLDSAAAARLELDELDIDGTPAPAVPPRDVNRSPWAMVAAASLLSAAIGVGATMLMRGSPAIATPADVTRFEINPPPGLAFPGANLIPRFAVSPDGRSIAVEAGPPGVGPFQLWIRPLDQVESRPLAGTAASTEVGAQAPFWFPDGQTLGYFDESSHQLKTIDLRSNQIRTLATVPGNNYGATVNANGVIVFASVGSMGLQRVAASGGVPQQVTTLADGELSHLWPAFLPDGDHFLYIAVTQDRTKWAVYLDSLGEREERRRLIATDSMAQFAPPDQLLFVRGGSLFAQQVTLSTFEPLGDPVLIAQPIAVTPQGRAGFSVSASGTLVHASGAGQGQERDPTWVDRSGREESMGLPRRRYSEVRLSPDAGSLVLTIADPERDLWQWSFSGKTLTRLTVGAAAQAPAWSPDSQQVAYLGGDFGVSPRTFLTSANGSTPPQLLGLAGGPSAFDPDGKILFVDGRDETTFGFTDVYALPVTGDQRPQRFIGGPLGQQKASVSPNARWVAYQTGESGRSEIMVRPYPRVDEGRWQVSTMGGTQPLWSRSGAELFYLALDGTLMSVRMPSGSEWSAASPTALFNSLSLFSGLTAVANSRATYDVAPDGRFIVLKVSAQSEGPATANLVVVDNWQQELKPDSTR